jgi:hypothetical protein
MSYKKGDVDITKTCDSYNDYKEALGIQLPHSCDAWVIGGVAEAKQMIADLEEAISKLSEQTP